MLSARNQFKGTVKEVKLGNVMAEVVISVGTHRNCVGDHARLGRKAWAQAGRYGDRHYQVDRGPDRQVSDLSADERR